MNDDEKYTSFDHLDSNPFADVIVDSIGDNSEFRKREVLPHWVGIPAEKVDDKGLLKRDILNRLDGIEDIHVFKLTLFGDMNVGKTSIIVRTEDNQFYGDACQATVGIDYVLLPMKIDDMYVKVEMWDTAGQERFRSILRSYYHKAAEGGIVLVYDVGNRESFLNIDTWYNDICEKGQIDHRKASQSDGNINQAKAKDDGNAGLAPFILLGNKCDLATEARAVTYEEGQAYAESKNMPFFEVSALDSTNVVQSLHYIVKVMYEHALKYGIARSSLHIANAQLAADAAQRKQSISFRGCGCK